MPDTSPPTMFSSTVSVAKTSSASAKNPTLWLGDLEKKKLEEEERLQRPQMAASRLSRTTNNQLGQSYGQPFTPAASFGAIQRNREIASHAPSATASANTNRATPALTSASRNFSNRNQPMHYSSVKTSYKGTGYKTREEYENRLELSDSE
uniref:Uncharacterized protein n=1 Tax=Ditylenchus dipsaci TaxID=166011 RepID=A0A915D566_9BILA